MTTFLIDTQPSRDSLLLSNAIAKRQIMCLSR